jgi:hypothetical protein
VGTLNNACNKEAGEFREWCERKHQTNYCINFPHEPWAVWRRNDKISTHFHQDVHDGIHDEAADVVWVASRWVNTEGQHLVYTEVLKKAAKELPVHKMIWIMRLRFGMCGVNQFMKRWKYRATSKCPQYGHCMETVRHVNRCPSPESLERSDKSLQELGSWMDKRQAPHPSIIDTLTTISSERLETQNIVLCSRRRAGISRSGSNEKEHRMGGITEGGSIVTLERNTTEYYIYLGKRNTGERWVRLLIQKIWNVDWDQWDHGNEVRHKQDSLVSQPEAEQLNGWIHEVIRIGSGKVLLGNNHLFRDILVDAAFKWTLTRKKRWKR